MWIKPRIIAFNETDTWNEETIKLTGNIYGVYMFDMNDYPYFCEQINIVYPNYIADEKEEEEIDWAWRKQDYSMYIDQYSLPDKMIELPSKRCKKEDYDECWEEIIDYETSNWSDYASLMTQEDIELMRGNYDKVS